MINFEVMQSSHTSLSFAQYIKIWKGHGGGQVKVLTMSCDFYMYNEIVFLQYYTRTIGDDTED